MRVGEYAKVWIESKKLRIDRSTARTYESAIERRIVPGLGQFFFDELTSLDVQKWVDDAMRHGWASAAKGSKQAQSATRRPYSPKAIAVWFRVLRTMTRDAMAVLNLPRDPTLRVSLPAPSAITSKPASCDRLKTGHFGRSGTVVDYFDSESFGKLAA